MIDNIAEALGALGICLVPPAFAWLSNFIYGLITPEDEWDDEEQERYEVGGLCIGIVLAFLVAASIPW